jgi:hypothetical protein
VSGSSSSLLKSEIGRVLTGRHMTFTLYPFSFKEYLIAQGWDKFQIDFLEGHKGKVLHFLEKYLEEGGFPETLGLAQIERFAYLNDLFEDIVARDVASRYKINYEIARRIAYYVLSHSSKTMTHRSIARACEVSVDSVSRYMGFFEECFLMIRLRRFSSRLKAQMKEVNKYYGIDTGMVNAVGFKLTDEKTRLLETLVLLELKRQKKDVYYWQDRQQREIDFLVKDRLKVKELIQVCYSLDSEKTLKREISALLSGMKQFNLDKGTIITWEKEASKRIGDKKIDIVPFWKWSLISRQI